MALALASQKASMQNAAARSVSSRTPPRVSLVARASLASGADMPDAPPDMDKRNTMNLLLAGALALPVGTMAGTFFSSFVPMSTGGGSANQAAKDREGNDIKAAAWLQSHLVGDRSLTQGLKGDPTYLVVNDNSMIENYGINAVCTHLGCVVPWVAAENKFKCNCHGSQYDATGKVVRGPAPLPLALAHADINPNGVVVFSNWTETDFRTGDAPWWK